MHVIRPSFTALKLPKNNAVTFQGTARSFYREVPGRKSIYTDHTTWMTRDETLFERLPALILKRFGGKTKIPVEFHAVSDGSEAYRSHLV